MNRRPDSNEFGAMYAAHFRPVWKTLARLGVPAASIDDAAQEVFVTAWKRREDFEGRSSVRTWLLGIAIRVASDARRRVRPTEAVSPALEAEAPGPERTVAAREQAARVQRLLAKLPDERREVLLLIDVEGYSAPEVAEATHTNLNTVYTRLRAARGELEALVRADLEAVS